jgi:hypothetical protein
MDQASDRATMYGISSNPSLHVDGVNIQASSDYLAALLYERDNTTSSTTITLGGSFQGTSGTVTVHLSQPAPAGQKLYAVITESGLTYRHGSNGEIDFDDVFRLVLGDGWAGNDIGSSTSIELPFTLGVDSLREPPYAFPWDPESCNIIVWLQDPSLIAGGTASVAQGAQIAISDLLTGVNDARQPAAVTISVSPNPFHDAVDITLSAHAADMQLSIVDLLGRTIFRAAGDAIPSHVSLAGYPAGVYRTVLSQRGHVLSSMSLVHN